MHLERNYHESRIMFAILNNNLHYLDGDKRGHLEWLRNDFNITDGEFNEITRGYIRNGTIAVYKGFKFSAVSKKSLINTINLIIREIPENESNNNNRYNSRLNHSFHRPHRLLQPGLPTAVCIQQLQRGAESHLIHRG